MSLRHALLALLSAGPATGYDAAKRFSGSVGHVWSAPDSQIYPELKRMQGDGLVESSAVRWGPRSTKTQYTITDAGLEELIDWVGRALPYSPPRDTHHLQAAYLEWTMPRARGDSSRITSPITPSSGSCCSRCTRESSRAPIR